MKLVTRNSVYEVHQVTTEADRRLSNGAEGFLLVKVSERQESWFNSLGSIRYASKLVLEIGEVVDCGLWHTSPLERIEV